MPMTRLMQEHLHGDSGENGDCFRAAVGSLLGIEDIREVPHFCSVAAEESPEGWFAGFLYWLEGRGYTAFDVPWDDEWARVCLQRATYILNGPSPRYPDERHAVVARGADATVVHDPHPDQRGVLTDRGEPTITVLMPLRPWR